MSGQPTRRVAVEPADWGPADLLVEAAETALTRLPTDVPLAGCVLVADALLGDDHAWFQLRHQDDGWHLRLWFHPDQVLRDRPGRGQALPEGQEWRLGPTPSSAPPVAAAEFSAPNAQRFLYQQLLVVDDMLAGRLDPPLIAPSLVEAFQEAWLITVDGRLQRAGLPHLSAGERRASFLRLFGATGVITPGHWKVFNQLWGGSLARQDEILTRVRLLPPLRPGGKR